MTDAPRHDDPRPAGGAVSGPAPELGRSIGGFEMRVEVEDGPTPPEALLPLARALSDATVAAAVAAAEREGRRVSCKAGCGACCRQVVPITEVEVRAVATLVERLPPERRAEVERRFGDAIRRLDEAGLLESVRACDPTQRGRHLALALGYFRLGIACPFLENESCSIYEERPLMCREYLVTTPAERCARLPGGGIDGIVVPQDVSNVLGSVNARNVREKPRYIPLILSLEWSRAHQHDRVLYDGLKLFQKFVTAVSGVGADAPLETETETGA